MALPQSTPTAQTCRQCGCTYPLTSEFWSRDRRRRNGLRTVCKECVSHYARAWYQRNQVAEAKRCRDYRQVARIEALSHYSAGLPSCACCGELRLEFLALDHIDGRGRRQRGALDRHGTSMYVWLRMHGYPAGYRVLCHNCNGALGYYGYCPHERERLAQGT